MRRRLFTILSALSLLLCVSVAGVWLYASTIGPFRAIETPRRSGVPTIDLVFESNRVAYMYSCGDPGFDSAVNLRLSYYNAPDKGLAVVIPYWMPVLIAVILPSAWLRMWRCSRLQLWRAKHGCCLNCGYDLRASSERCPECGTANVA